MTTAEYLSAVLKSQALAEDSSELKALRAKRKDVEGLLKKAFEERSPTIRYGGSHAKDTLIRESYDLDLTCYFAHDDDGAGDNLKDIYDNVAVALEGTFMVDRKTSALRLRGKSAADLKVDFHIDVVPGRFTSASKGDVYIHQENADKERMKTNLDVHLERIKGSGVRDAIKLVKLWKVRHWFNLKTFVLELMVIEAIGKKKAIPTKLDLLEIQRTSVEDMYLTGRCRWTDLDAIVPFGLGNSHKLVTTIVLCGSDSPHSSLLCPYESRTSLR